MKVLGHPVHMMLIHFPSALFPMDFVFALLAFCCEDSYLAHTAFYCMVAGTALGVLAVFTGALDLIQIAKNKPGVLPKALLHGGINASVVIVYTLLSFMALHTYPILLPDSLGKLIVKGSLVVFLIAGNYLGGSLILKDKVAIHN